MGTLWICFSYLHRKSEDSSLLSSCIGDEKWPALVLESYMRINEYIKYQMV